MVTAALTPTSSLCSYTIQVADGLLGCQSTSRMSWRDETKFDFCLKAAPINTFAMSVNESVVKKCSAVRGC